MAAGRARRSLRLSRRTVAIGAVAGVLVLGAITSGPTASGDVAAAPTATPSASQTAPPTTSPTPDRTPTPRIATVRPAPTFGPTGATVEARVVRVIDGDTIEVGVGGGLEKVRYIGVDTPETVAPGSPVEWMGPEASKANEALVLGQTVLLESDVRDRDDFGRLLRYVWVSNGASWTLVNLELVRRGFASVATYPPDVKYVDLFVDAEQTARAADDGLWGATPPPATPAATPVPTAVTIIVPDPEPETGCHPSYDPCLPIVADLDCADVRALGKDPVDVIGPDAYQLDGTDNDGLGCE